MSISKTIKSIKKNLINIPGWSTNRKLLVIESDDWGGIRMSSRQLYEDMLVKGIGVNKNYFTKYDILENVSDLKALFEVLENYKDKNGNHPVITANCVVANPDFAKIEASGKSEYHYELITDTYKKYYPDEDTFGYWKKEGIEKKRLLWPQFHGREHINVFKWMKAINSGIEQEAMAFEHKAILGLGLSNDTKREYNYMSALEYTTDEERTEMEKITTDGLKIFNELFGFKSTSFVSPCSVQGDHLDAVLKDGGVQYHQCGQKFVPTDNGQIKVVNRFWGQKNEVGQIYWRRNAMFEPSKNHNLKWADSCMEEIAIAFRWGKPAVLNSHRVCYVGSMFPENREESLAHLDTLLKKVIKKWPDVEFISSDQLGEIMSKKK